MNSTKQLIEKVEKLFVKEKHQEIIDLLSNELLNEYNNARLYFWRGAAYEKLDNLNKAIQNYNIAIEINDNDVFAYNNRGVIWHEKEEWDKAIKDYNKVIEIDPDNSMAYNNRGNIWYEKNNLDKAIEDYSKAIQINPIYQEAFQNRGLAWIEKKEFNKAIKDYSKCLEIDPKSINPYYNRGSAWKERGEFKKAIEDYRKYLKLTPQKNNYWAKQAKANIEELNHKINIPAYNNITNIVEQIKDLLIFKEDCITHYTSLSTTRILILNENSKFRLSEGAFLNDTSEGRALFDFLDNFHLTENITDKTIAEPFTEKPFIGSFVPKIKHDDLTLWRMYGKESGTEAKGCALTINREKFVDAIQQSIKKDAITEESFLSNTDFTFYSVAYLDKGNFIIPGATKKKQKELNDLMKKLSETVKNVTDKYKVLITEKLNEIAYLFKSADYLFEHEVRLIIDGVGFEKGIDNETPKVYVELVDIRPALEQITLGPKIEKAEEWAATFNYYIKQNYNDKDTDIVISHLPFK
ncbi:tetratricopeptide repeat protein [Flavobacterium litorale]|uniref:Tetratricopeptide repeat protein n=1 Tax=Flavobacterium litorale TaxID=2856519 RepID=A0ABX8VDA7_9FLAO|nr:tetratricopeptide repeat protein [Flavobacterium litorale]QYJ68621.1 tetratricopeptide repeat protein [Flavobacterium litorale]